MARFVVQLHDARRLHYDFRLEVDGVLASWAVPKGPSYDPSVKRLAVHVEDHGLDYASFEGAIPDAHYGSGSVVVWDEGTFENRSEVHHQPASLRDAIEAGHVSVFLEGRKLHGGWILTRTKRIQSNQDAWLLIKRDDEQADPTRDVTGDEPGSVLTGRTYQQVAADARESLDPPPAASGGSASAGGTPVADAGGTTESAAWRPVMLARPASIESLRSAAGRGPWSYERKLDGVRCLAVRNGDDVQLWSRNHLSFTGRFPTIARELASWVPSSYVLDGEIVAFDGTATSFSRLQRPSATTEIRYVVFDLLALLGHDTTTLALEERRRLLTRLVPAHSGSARAVLLSEVLEGDPGELLDRACREGWEGLLAKRSGSRYVAGRSDDWLKLKCLASQEVVVGGWTEPKGSRFGFGALLVGVYEGTSLRYAGKVGTGFDDAALHDLAGRLAAIAREGSPFADPVPERRPHWVEPLLVAHVQFGEWTPDGRLRHPSFSGLRTDKPAREVARDETRLPPAPRRGE